ncbi:MAG: hypothetical protein ACI9SP_003436 [Arenicella sp.]|jgi:hypothetical protein
MFFTDARIQFFKPLTGKYREHVCACLGLLYNRQYGASADYGHSLTRDQIIEILEQALIQLGEVTFSTDELEDNSVEERFKTAREHANWVLKQLIEHGWIERQVDTATLQSTFPFSRMGRVFAQSLLEADSSRVRTRHRNTRNTLNALDAFANRGEVYDLLDAFDYSERIVTDFTDVISELEEKKRALVQEMESQQLIQQAAEQFFDFMEKRFQPDIQVRLSADSVEKHRDHIDKRISSIRRKKDQFKRDAEADLRRTVPDLCESHQSYLYYILDTIERRMHNAADVMLPALRRALHGFTKRADIIIRQLSYLNTQQDSNLVDVCRELADLSPADYTARVSGAAQLASTFKLGLIDPQQVKLIERKSKEMVDNNVAEALVPDRDAQCELMVQQLLDQAFVVNSQGIKDYVLQTLRDGRKLSTKELQISNADELLAMAHAIEVAGINNLSSNLTFKVSRKGNETASNEYYQRFDEHEIELIDSSPSEHGIK